MAHSPRFLEIVETARAGVKETSVSEVIARIAVGDAFSNILGRRYGRVKLPWNPAKSRKQ